MTLADIITRYFRPVQLAGYYCLVEWNVKPPTEEPT